VDVQFSASNVEMNILQTKWCIVAGGACVFPWSQEEEKHDHNHVGNFQIGIRAMVIIGLRKDVQDDIDRNWLHTEWGTFHLLVRGDMSLDAEVNAAVRVFPWVRAPQSGMRLANRP
jgi:hypothetical protein